MLTSVVRFIRCQWIPSTTFGGSESLHRDTFCRCTCPAATRSTTPAEPVLLAAGQHGLLSGSPVQPVLPV